MGKFNLPLDEIKKLTICPKHRHDLAQYWRPLKTCQYPNHEGRKVALHCKNPVSWEMAQEIQTMFITLVQVGSRENFFLFVTRSLKQLLQRKAKKKNENPYKNKSWMKYFVMLTNFFFSNIQECHDTKWAPNTPVATALIVFLN